MNTFCFMKTIFSSKFCMLKFLKFPITRIVTILLISMFIQIVLINKYYKNIVEHDSVTYHTLAVNMARGNGYSVSKNTTFPPYFFREPAYPVFLSGIICLYNLSHKADYFKIDADVNYHYHCKENTQNEIYWIQVAQALLNAISIVILYLTFRQFLHEKIAFIAALLFVFYLPFAALSGLIMRETFYSFVLIAMNYFFIKFISTKHAKWLLFFAFFCAISCHTLQFSKMIPFFFLVYLIIISRKLWYSIKQFGIVLVILTALLLPWIIRSYSFFPDIRVAKTLGSSLTHEQIKYCSALRLASKKGFLNIDEAQSLCRSAWAAPDFEKFRLSFDGDYQHKADSILKAINGPLSSKQKLIGAYHLFRNFWIDSFFPFVPSGGRVAKECIYSNKFVIKFIKIFQGAFALICFISLFYHFKKLFPYFFIFFYFLLFFYFISSEVRRVIPVHGYIFVCGIIGVAAIINLFKKNKIVIFLTNPKL